MEHLRSQTNSTDLTNTSPNHRFFDVSSRLVEAAQELDLTELSRRLTLLRRADLRKSSLYRLCR